ncbi:DUF5060 domain-containing protein [uncultured Aquimarina sp.]|uniref:DUF5060 domain-containing protein n=1 Tax=uncultured Aquimarina sp. TaxID=575652 RepID=UPI0026242428|nr:DUF5060 domain-containing protein [uncultured Aquimarina sp.]
MNSMFSQDYKVAMEGELKKWHKVTLSFEGSELNENDEENPFLNYRLTVTFRNSKKVYTVPGFFAADGRAAHTSAKKGKVWQVRFTPDKVGEWSYQVSFRKGDQIAINNNPDAGKSVMFDGLKGKFLIADTDKKDTDFRGKGRLQYVGERYLQFSGSKEYFIKGGAGSPENFLGFYEFDQTPPSHKYQPHENDWNQGDPTWQKDKGKNIIGALNYLASKGMNSVYFLIMNVQGDGKDVWPWNNVNERYRFDCSKLDQWEIVFDHMEKLGVALHFITQETENELLLDIGELGVQRKLYYRELIARFSHHLGVIWNLGEENGPVHWSPKGQSDADRKTMAAYIKKNDPYKNFVTLHTHSIKKEQDQILKPLLGYNFLEGSSLQVHNPDEVHEITKKWISVSRKSKKDWVVNIDEIGPADTGAKPDVDNQEHNEIRSKVLWGNLMAGGAGVEWYFGYKFAHNDLNCEDWRSRSNLWDQTKYAMDFFKNHVPFNKMKSVDELTNNPDDYVLAKNGETYVIYLPKVTESIIDLYGVEKEFSIKWYNPRKGGELKNGSIIKVKGGKTVSIGYPPNSEKDWVAILNATKKTKRSDSLLKEGIIKLEALNDFTIQNSLDKAVYYKDIDNKALAINTEDKNQRNKFASAKSIFPGKEGLYDVSFISLAENDGESVYILRINGSIKDTISNPSTTKSFASVRHNIDRWYLSENDIIEISSIATTNKKIPENGETAWSRGRWRSITFTSANLSMEEQLKKAKPFLEKNGFLDIEAEKYQYSSSNGTKRDWYKRSENTILPFEKGITNHYIEASNTAYIEALPDTRITHQDPLKIGENFFPTPGNGAIVAYKINVKTPGKYYIWARAFSTGTEDNGVHVGIDGTWPESGARMQWCEGKDKWTWSSAQRVPDNHCGVKHTISLDIKNTGDHIITFSMREDGFEMDKWIMTQDVKFIPR